VHGGLQRVLYGVDALVGDVTITQKKATVSGADVTGYVCVVAGSPGVWKPIFYSTSKKVK
jgi:hypothetical protein